MTSKDKKVNRQSLITFIILGLVMLAQLIWWVSFQLGMNDTRHREYLASAEGRQLDALSQLAGDYRSVSDLMLLEKSQLTRETLDSLRRELSRNKFISGVILRFGRTDTLFRFGSQYGDAGFTVQREGLMLAVTMNYQRATEIAEQSYPKLVFLPQHSDSLFFEELSARNFALDSAESAFYIEEKNSTRIMLLSEGAFFMALTLLGLGLIYRALVKSEEARRSQENFLMAVTHELRTPLASARLSLQGIIRGKLPPESANRALQMIDTDMGRLAKLIDELLLAGRSSRVAPKAEHVSLNDFLSANFAERRREFDEKGIRLNLSLAEDQCYALVSSAEFTRAFDTVVDNALKFSNGYPEITVELRADSGFAYLTITDNGIGIEKEELPKVFERFYRVGNEATRNQPGVGIGLFLARQLMVPYNVELQLSSAGAGKGTTATFTLPLEEEKVELADIERDRL